jgi:hypothetical protein
MSALREREIYEKVLSRIFFPLSLSMYFPVFRAPLNLMNPIFFNKIVSLLAVTIYILDMLSITALVRKPYFTIYNISFINRFFTISFIGSFIVSPIVLSNLSFSAKKDISFLIGLLKVTVKNVSNSNSIPFQLF